jgi:hypothetical protein
MKKIEKYPERKIRGKEQVKQFHYISQERRIVS